MSNGPFLDVALDGSSPGGEVRPAGAAGQKVRVWCADWFDIDRVQVLVNGRADPALNFTRGRAAAGFKTGPGALRFEREIPIDLTVDAHVIVIAAGETSHLGAFNGPHGQEAPTAVSNPIFVDVDGNGFKANGDSLGLPLPVSSRPRNSPTRPAARQQ